MSHEPLPSATAARAGRPGRSRIVGFAVVAAATVALAAGYGAYAVWRQRAASAAAPTLAITRLNALPGADAARADPAHAADAGMLVFVNNALGEGFGRVGAEALADRGSARRVGALSCDRVHYERGVGICLETVRKGLASYRAQVFDERLVVRHTLPLAGPPSRARMSRDGRWAAFTVFVTGHSYDSPGFSTRTSIIDTRSGEPLVADLESLPVRRGAELIKAADFNFWGVTFTPDGAGFYATLGTGGRVHLVRGDLRARTMELIHDDVECPSLSPDGRLVAFKRRAAADAAGRRIWRLVVLDLQTGRETLLGQEARNVDDQVEWLDGREILYALPRGTTQATGATDVWALAVDDASPPRLLLPYAFSPSAMR